MGKYIYTSYRTLLSRCKRKIIGWPPRKIHCFCIGAEKTGTTSIHHMFNKNYRVNHEPFEEETIAIGIDYMKGKLSKNKISKIFTKRDKLLNLEMESSHLLVHVSDVLINTFPEAKFIITIREPYSHLQSRLNWHLAPRPYHWDCWVNYFLGKKHTGYHEKEKLLKKLNLYSLDTYLQQYANHYKIIFSTIPEEKRLFIETHNLNVSINKIAKFLNVEETSIKIAHAEKNSKKIPIVEELDQSFVRNKIWENCQEIIQEFFPETIHLYDQR